MKRSIIAAAMSLVLLSACGGDDDDNDGGITGTGNTLLNQALCVRGGVAVGQTRSGTIETTDCDLADQDESEQGYFESYVIRVGSTRNVTFDVTTGSTMRDLQLYLLEVEGANTAEPTVTIVDYNDDEDIEADHYDPLLTSSLTGGRTYVVVVAGLGYSQTGTYSLAVR